MKSVYRYAIMRIVRLMVCYFLILTVVFILPRIAPGDPVRNTLGLDYVSASQYEIDFLMHKYGLDKSLWEQYVLFIKSVFTLDFGYSFTNEAPVMETLKYSAVQSVKLILPALIIGSLFALLVGIHCGTKKGSLMDRTVTGTMVVLYAIPTFIIGIVVLTIFAYHLGWFPLGHSSTGRGGLADNIYCLVLPIATLTLIVFSGYYLIIRSATVQIEDEHFIQVEREHGFSEDYVNSNHILRNISTQFVSMFAISLGGMVSGAMIIEVIFSLNGMGTVLYNAISFGDYPVIQGAFIFITASVLIANLVAEILYSILDPRVAEGIH